jgi:hypothetical protein
MSDILFVDKNQEFIQHINTLFEDTPIVRGMCDDIRNINVKNAVFLAPCDMLLNMNRGVSKVYTEDIFPFIQVTAMLELRSLNITTSLGRLILPIGSSISVCAQPETETYVLFAPSMFLAQNVSESINAYHSFMSALCLIEKMKNSAIKHLICPSICTGIGGMAAKDSAFQIFAAFQDYTHRTFPRQISHFEKQNVYITPFDTNNQPNYYENLEIKSIDIDKIKYKK